MPRDVVHPPEVVNSVRRMMVRMGCQNPDTYINRFCLADIVTVMPEFDRQFTANPNIRNPAGLLWKILERQETQIKVKEVKNEN